MTTPTPYIKFDDNMTKTISNFNLYRAEITVAIDPTTNAFNFTSLKNIPTIIKKVSVKISGTTINNEINNGIKDTDIAFYPVLISAIVNNNGKYNFISNFSSSALQLNFQNNNISVTIPTLMNISSTSSTIKHIKIVILYIQDNNYNYTSSSTPTEYYQNQNLSKYIGIF